MTVVSLLLVTGAAMASERPVVQDTLKVDYFSNANTSGAPDATVHIVNPGTTYATICADIYVFDDSQEMSECCSCSLSANSIRTLSVNGDLTGNPLTGKTLTHGAIKIVSAAYTGKRTCADPAKIVPTPATNAWATHIQTSNFTITEGESQNAGLSSGEVTALDAQCSAIELDGSGSGICTCGTGD
jgi:hypothetical protein